jgi:hypothetical protein
LIRTAYRRSPRHPRSHATRTIVAAAVVSGLVAAVPGLAAGRTLQLAAKLAPEVARAKHGGVAVLLPSTIAGDPDGHRVYFSGGAVAGGYDIQIAYAPRCNDATACFFAEFEGGRQTRLPGTAVALAHAITGVFSGIHCGASCGPASIQWKEGGVLYSVQYVLGGKPAMVALADSAIEAGPR